MTWFFAAIQIMLLQVEMVFFGMKNYQIKVNIRLFSNLTGHHVVLRYGLALPLVAILGLVIPN